MLTKEVLRVDNISKFFEDTKVVDNLSFTVSKGEIFGLLGPNGAGKTTTIRMIMGIFTADRGSIKLDKELRVDKSKIGYLPEERGIYEDTKVLETIIYFAYLKGMDKSKAEREAYKWLERLNLKEQANSKIESLSKGMTQKLQFIIAIIHRPNLLVVDELFSGLDPVNQNLFKEIILELAADGVTIVLSSHQMNLVEELCNRIFMINQGRQVLYGNLGQIKNKFGVKQVKISFKGDSNLLTTNSKIRNLKLEEGRAEFNLIEELSTYQFLQSLSKELEIEEISILNPPLHDIFINQVEGGNKNA